MATFKYRAFLSYSHRDTAWARWLHKGLESYRIDRDLVGRETPCGPIPKTLRPIFRDREDFSAGHSLCEQTRSALDASQFLIVICSPNAAASKYVDEEIRHFKELGGASRVIPLIVDGEPGDSARECFPPALRFQVGGHGTLTTEREELIAADARPEGDVKEIAKQKIVAGLLGVGLDEIIRRAERARKRRNSVRIIGASAGGVVISGGAYAWLSMNSFYGQLRVQEDLNSVRDAATICENSAHFLNDGEISEARRITLASECVETFSQLLGSLPDGTRVPKGVLSSLKRYIEVMRMFKNENKLSLQQAKILSSGEGLIDQFGSL